MHFRQIYKLDVDIDKELHQEEGGGGDQHNRVEEDLNLSLKIDLISQKKHIITKLLEILHER